MGDGELLQKVSTWDKGVTRIKGHQELRHELMNNICYMSARSIAREMLRNCIRSRA